MKQWTAEDIKKFRQKRGLYQKNLAKLLRVTVQYVCNLEKGVRTPSNTMKALLDCLERQENKKGKESKRHGKRNL